MKFTTEDEQFMRRALTLARRGLGKTSPNPAVGAVLVKDGTIIGEGWHKRAGGPHAEVWAFRKAEARSQKLGFRRSTKQKPGRGGDAAPTSGAPGGRALPTAKGAALYVTMEPCSTWGKTPPCTDAIIAAGVKRVVVAALDPNPKHNGRGLEILRRAGIRVEHGLLADESAVMNEAFNKWITTGLPFIIAKAGMSLDGKIATRTGDAKWITGEAARREGHNRRAKVDAIVVGANTAIRDDPQLTLRHGLSGKQPLRVVVDTRGRTPVSAKLFNDAHRKSTFVLTTKFSSARWRRFLAQRGVDVIIVAQKSGRVDLRAGLKALGKRNVTSVLVEGGSELLGSLFDARLVDKVMFFYAPIILGGRKAITAVAGEGVLKVKGAIRLVDCQWKRLRTGEMLLEARIKR